MVGTWALWEHKMWACSAARFCASVRSHQSSRSPSGVLLLREKRGVDSDAVDDTVAVHYAVLGLVVLEGCAEGGDGEVALVLAALGEQLLGLGVGDAGLRVHPPRALLVHPTPDLGPDQPPPGSGSGSTSTRIHNPDLIA